MIKVSIEVHSGAARFGVAVQAESVQWALSLAERYPGKDCRVKVPIDPECFFIAHRAAQAEMVEMAA